MRKRWAAISDTYLRCCGRQSDEEVVISQCTTKRGVKVEWAEKAVPYALGTRLRNAPNISINNFETSLEGRALKGVLNKLRDQDYIISEGSWSFTSGVQLSEQDLEDVKTGRASPDEEQTAIQNRLIKKFARKARRLSVTDQIAVSPPLFSHRPPLVDRIGDHVRTTHLVVGSELLLVPCQGRHRGIRFVTLPARPSIRWWRYRGRR